MQAIVTSYMNPGILLAVAVAFIAAQLTRVVAPRNTPYPFTLALAVGGVLLAEVLVQTLHHGGPTLGVIHPVADVMVVVVLEIAGLVVWPQRQAPA